MLSYNKIGKLLLFCFFFYNMSEHGCLHSSWLVRSLHVFCDLYFLALVSCSPKAHNYRTCCCFRCPWIKFTFLGVPLLQTVFWCFTFRALLWKLPAHLTAELLLSDLSLASSVQFPADRVDVSLIRRLCLGTYLTSWVSLLQTFSFFFPSFLHFTSIFCSLSSQ